MFRVREVVQTLYNFSLRPNWGLPIYVCDLDLNSKSKKCKLHFVFVLSSTVEMYDIKKMMSSMICVTQCGVYLREIINEFVRCSWMWGVWALLVFSALGFIDLLVSGFYRSSQLWALLIFSVLNFTDLLSSGLYWSQLWTLLIFQLWALLIFSASLNTKSLTHTKNKKHKKNPKPPQTNKKQTKNQTTTTKDKNKQKKPPDMSAALCFSFVLTDLFSARFISPLNGEIDTYHEWWHLFQMTHWNS